MSSSRKLSGFVDEKLSETDWKKVLVMNIPYLIVLYGQYIRKCYGTGTAFKWF